MSKRLELSNKRMEKTCSLFPARKHLLMGWEWEAAHFSVANARERCREAFAGRCACRGLGHGRDEDSTEGAQPDRLRSAPETGDVATTIRQTRISSGVLRSSFWCLRCGPSDLYRSSRALAGRQPSVRFALVFRAGTHRLASGYLLLASMGAWGEPLNVLRRPNVEDEWSGAAIELLLRALHRDLRYSHRRRDSIWWPLHTAADSSADVRNRFWTAMQAQLARHLTIEYRGGHPFPLNTRVNHCEPAAGRLATGVWRFQDSERRRMTSRERGDERSATQCQLQQRTLRRHEMPASEGSRGLIPCSGSANTNANAIQTIGREGCNALRRSFSDLDGGPWMIRTPAGAPEETMPSAEKVRAHQLRASSFDLSRWSGSRSRERGDLARIAYSTNHTQP
ncbi:hypothetical protein FOMPIDRAFT_1017423 [Fomitopsis schrenkii]|uniref:Uncharacterized protein n=1 Tax=Fomitopsis schrenkii TaxID=2126942 RepID=S8E687_FOMSC|nr:hypothetical protein FOMPIDRAFT_1017423 [Fomitopsis schrenkii]